MKEQQPQNYIQYLDPRIALGQAQSELKQIRRLNESFGQGNWKGAKRHMLILYPWRLIVLSVRQMLANHVLMRASSLAFITVTSLVPMLVVAGSLIMVFSGSNDKEGSQGLIDLVQQYLMPVAGDTISSFIREAIERTTDSGVGIAGGFALIFTAVTLVLEIEDSFNDIWKVSQRRTLSTRVLLFYTLVTLGPLILVFSLVQATSAGVLMEQLGPIGTLAHQLIPFLTSALFFSSACKLLPNTKVHFYSAILSGTFTALIFEASKFGFTYYTSNVLMARYDQIYGPLSLIPVFLLWVYISWVLILFGAQLGYSIQNLQSLMRAEQIEDEFLRTEHSEAIASAFIGVEIFAPIAWQFYKGEPPLEADEIAACSGYTPAMVLRALKRLVREGQIIRLDKKGKGVYLPARPLDRIQLVEILEIFEVEVDKIDTFSIVQVIAKRLDHARKKTLGDLNFHDFVLSTEGSMKHTPDEEENQSKSQNNRELSTHDRDKKHNKNNNSNERKQEEIPSSCTMISEELEIIPPTSDEEETQENNFIFSKEEKEDHFLENINPSPKEISTPHNPAPHNPTPHNPTPHNPAFQSLALGSDTLKSADSQKGTDSKASLAISPILSLSASFSAGEYGSFSHFSPPAVYLLRCKNIWISNKEQENHCGLIILELAGSEVQGLWDISLSPADPEDSPRCSESMKEETVQLRSRGRRVSSEVISLKENEQASDLLKISIL